MADCDPLIDAGYVATVTGADVSDSDRVEALIQITSNLVGEILGTGCVDPAEASTRLKVTVAQFVARGLASTPQQEAVRAEQIGDYRVEFVAGTTGNVGIDVDVLRKMLTPLMPGGKNYSVQTIDKGFGIDAVPVVN